MFDRRPRLASSARRARPGRVAAAYETPSLQKLPASSSTLPPEVLSSRCDAEPSALVRNMLFSAIPMDTEALYDRSPSLVDAENWLALGAGALLLLVGASRRSTVGACLAVSSAPLLYRGITGRWPDVLNGIRQPDSTKTALGGERGVHVRESIRLEVPVADVYRFWRRLENLPRFMTHLDRVTETRRRHVALGGRQGPPGWPSNGTPRSSTRSRTRSSRGVRFPDPTSSPPAR